MRAFENFYNEKISWFELEITAQRKKFTNHLAQKIKNLKKLEKITSAKISEGEVTRNWKEVLKENLNINIMLNFKEKSIINKIIKKTKLNEENKKQLISILSKLPTKQVISLLGEDFEKHTKNYIKWGWDYDQGIKRLMLKKFLKKGYKRVAIQEYMEDFPFNVNYYKNNKEVENEREFYSVFKFFRDIKRGLCRIEKKRLTYRQISVKFLNLKNKWVINDKILHSKGDRDYIIDATLLSLYEKRIKSKIGKEFSKLKKFFERYRSINLNNRLEASTKLHPDLDITYFKKIDSKRKAYWLGWLYAEGHLSRKFLRVDIGVKDGILIKRFVEDLGLNPRKVHFYRRYDPRSHRYSWVFSIKINNKEFRDHLRNFGFLIGKKSGIVRFPDFSNPLLVSIGIKKELEMAFLLGFFDGDGTHSSRANGKPNTPVITSKSQEFLQDIVEKFNLPSFITPKPKYNIEGDFQGYYYLGIGAKFFMTLYKNYERSLPRKRVIYSRFYGKFLFSRDELQKIVENNPFITSKEIVHLHNELKGIKISQRTVIDKINKWKIEKLSRDEYFRQKTIELRLKGWSLKRIYEKKFKLKNWGTYSKVFFKRIFKNDQHIDNKGDILKKIAEFYKLSKSGRTPNK